MKQIQKAQLLLGFIILLAISLCLTPTVDAKIYRYTSPDGAVLFSDVPQQGARQVILPPVSHYSEPVLKTIQ
jgi:hypothetical protein